MAARLAAVTGATGFLGRHVVRELAAAGWRVRILSRRDPVHPLWRDLEPEAVIGDLADDAALDRLCAGADLVVHIAGLIKAHDRAAFFKVNEEGSRRLAERVEKDMILVSSLAAREPQLSDYAASKRAGEDAAREILRSRLGVVRPPALYGPGDAETLPLFQLAASSPILPVFDPRTRLALMHVEDTARQIAALSEGPMGFNLALSDSRPEGYGWREILQTAAETVGRAPLFVRIPTVALTGLAFIGQLKGRRGPPPMLTLGKAREIRHNDWSVHPAERSYNLPAPRFDIVEGFLHSVEGYRTDGVPLGGGVSRLAKT